MCFVVFLLYAFVIFLLFICDFVTFAYHSQFALLRLTLSIKKNNRKSGKERREPQKELEREREIERGGVND